MAKKRGRTICDALKLVRQQIADANDIKYSSRECHHKGECRGTCPACEAEVRWLEQSLMGKFGSGFVQKVAGVAVGLMAAGASANAQIVCQEAEVMPEDSIVFNGKKIELSRDSLQQEGYYLVNGIVKDHSGEPIIGAFITSGREKFTTMTNVDGEYLIPLKPGDSIEISFIGMETQAIPFDSLDTKRLNVNVMKDDSSMLQGEVVVVGAVSSRHIKRENRKFERLQRKEEKARIKAEKAELKRQKANNTSK